MRRELAGSARRRGQRRQRAAAGQLALEADRAPPCAARARRLAARPGARPRDRARRRGPRGAPPARGRARATARARARRRRAARCVSAGVARERPVELDLERRHRLAAAEHVRPLVGLQALALAPALPRQQRGVEPRAGRRATGAAASPSSRPKRSASRMPCAVTGSLKWPASPGSAQPGPDERRKYEVVSVAERTFVDPLAAARAARAGRASPRPSARTRPAGRRGSPSIALDRRHEQHEHQAVVARERRAELGARRATARRSSRHAGSRVAEVRVVAGAAVRVAAVRLVRADEPRDRRAAAVGADDERRAQLDLASVASQRTPATRPPSQTSSVTRTPSRTSAPASRAVSTSAASSPVRRTHSAWSMPSTGVNGALGVDARAADQRARAAAARPARGRARARRAAPSSATPDGNSRCVEIVSAGNATRSSATTRRPARASAIAAADPAQRAPTTTASAPLAHGWWSSAFGWPALNSSRSARLAASNSGGS